MFTMFIIKKKTIFRNLKIISYPHSFNTKFDSNTMLCGQADGISALATKIN